ncbi:MAG TPA: DUF2946 family protein [Stellaceae bacterium]|nr:DUF2946 family protein [Stellaceae bacterium]
MRQLRRNRVGIWLGVLAVAFYAWLPGHFAGHVAFTALDALAALDGAHGEPTSHRHAHHPGGHDEHHGGTCPICAAAAASAAPAAAMLPALAALPAPRSMAAPAGMAEARAVLRAVSLTPYAPRGPPPAA